MELSPSEANIHPASQIPCLLWNLKIHYHTQTGLPLVPILSHPSKFEAPC